MKNVLHYALVSALATALAISTASVLAAPTVSTGSEMNAIELENAQADAALNGMATDIVNKYGIDAAPKVLAVRLGMLKALCEGVDPTRVAQAANGGKKANQPQPLRIQTMELHQMKIKHPLCSRLTAQPI